jgi:predicted ArsR family transcriptional regulator
VTEDELWTARQAAAFLGVSYIAAKKALSRAGVKAREHRRQRRGAPLALYRSGDVRKMPTTAAAPQGAWNRDQVAEYLGIQPAAVSTQLRTRGIEPVVTRRTGARGCPERFYDAEQVKAAYRDRPVRAYRTYRRSP